MIEAPRKHIKSKLLLGGLALADMASTAALLHAGGFGESNRLTTSFFGIAEAYGVRIGGTLLALRVIGSMEKSEGNDPVKRKITDVALVGANVISGMVVADNVSLLTTGNAPFLPLFQLLPFFR